MVGGIRMEQIAERDMICNKCRKNNSDEWYCWICDDLVDAVDGGTCNYCGTSWSESNCNCEE